MPTPRTRPATPAGLSDSGADESSRSAVSWPAIFAGALVAVAFSFMLVFFGTGLGFATVSPWPNSGTSATTFAVTTAIWLIIVQWVSSGLGGYLTGRLRTKWVGTHTHEVFFRDTAHGLVAWCLATVITAAAVMSGLSSLAGSGVQAASHVASGAAQGAGQGAAGTGGDQSGYLMDTLFRSDRPDPNASGADAKAEATRIVATSLANGSMAPSDRTYLAQLVSARTGIAQPEAEKRVDELSAKAKAAETKAREAADAARKAASRLSFYTFFSMLIGAFIACVAAAFGGQQRDEW